VPASRLTSRCQNPCNSALFLPVTGATYYETHLSTLKDPSCAHARFPRAHENPRWTCSNQCPASQRTRTSGSLKSTRLRLPRQAKLRGRAQFTGAFAKRSQGAYFVVLRRNKPLEQAARLGIVIGRHTAPRSVTRSLMKRAIREIFRQMRAQLGPGDIVVRVRQQARRSDMPAARNELERLLRETC
jgi:ribonuclease P protein component